MLSEGTIIALSTPQGSGAIGVIRLSGLLAIEKAAYFIHTKSKKSWNEIIPNTTFLGDFKVGNQLIDEVLITFFKGPHSYTGEDVVEPPDDDIALHQTCLGKVNPGLIADVLRN